MLWKITLGISVALAAALAWQTMRAERLATEIAIRERQIAGCQANLGDVLRDRERDNEIDNLPSDDLRRRAIDRGWVFDVPPQ